MLVVHNRSDLAQALQGARIRQRCIALVPTMGALHAGHISLVKKARQLADFVVVSIFVNPLQFNSAADLDKYPRTLERDVALLSKEQADLVFAPTQAEIYQHGFESANSARVKAGSMSQGLCGAARPGHFDGVVTVVSILFNLVQPDFALFGEKDYQQLKVIEQLVHDLHYAPRIIPGALVRDQDGLALSSRNQRLSAAERKAALAIPNSLFEVRALVESGESNAAKLKEFVRHKLQRSELKVDYVSIVDPDTLLEVESIITSAQLLVAAFVGEVRLIDNIRLTRTSKGE